jgi:hypothetical protein
MATTYEIGAIFTLANQASPALKALSEQFAALGKQVADLGKLGTDMTASLAGAFDKVTGGSGLAVDAVRTLNGELAKTVELSKGVGGGGGLRGRGSSGGGWFGMGKGRTQLAEGLLAGVGYGAFLDAEIQDQIARMMITGNIPENQMAAMRPKLHDMIQQMVAQTGFSPKEVGESLLGVERMLGGLPLDQRMNVEQQLIPYAATEARLKETDLKSSFEALVGLAHMTGTFDPAKLPDLLRQFTYTSLITKSPIDQFERTLSYSMPELHAGLGMDPNSIMLLTALSQNAGVTSSKSGTWIRSLFENAEPAVGGSEYAKKHNEALASMGLMDAGGKANWQVAGADGKTDWQQSIIKLSSELHDFVAKTPPDQVLGIMKQALGERGGGEASLLSMQTFVDQLAKLGLNMNSFKGGPDALGILGDQSPVQQTHQALADLQSALMDLGSVVLPLATKGIQAFDQIVLNIAGAFGDSGALSKLDDGQKAAIAALHNFPSIVGTAFSTAISSVETQFVTAIGGIPGALAGAIAAIPGTITGLFKGGNGGPAPNGFSAPPSTPGTGMGKQSSNGTPVNIRTAIYLDGKVIGQSTSSALAQLSTFPRQAAAADSYAGWWAPDGNATAG